MLATCLTVYKGKKLKFGGRAIGEVKEEMHKEMHREVHKEVYKEEEKKQV